MKQLLALSLLLVGVYPYLTVAEEVAENGTLSVVLENDVFYGIDRHYTNGLRIVWVPGSDTPAPDWAVNVAKLVPWFPREGEMIHGYALGQSMFAPSDKTLVNPPLDDRPYAGWLYVTMGLGVESGRELDLMSVSIGMVGPASLAEEIQTFVHRFTNTPVSQGWDTQLENEPGILVSYQRSWRALATKTYLKNDLDFTPHLGMTFGNVFTYANAGITARYGRQLPFDFGPPRIQPGLPGYGDFSPASDFGWYFFIGIDARAVAQNIFLDGNTFRDSRSVDKKTLVGDLQLGIVLDWPDMRLSYTHVVRSREFETQENNDIFGAISVSFKF